MTILNLTSALERLISDMVQRVPALAHINPRRLLICVATTRGGGIHGTYARIHPLRFAGGRSSTTVRRRGRDYSLTMPTVTHRGEEVLYLIYFLVPRFLNLSFRDKLITVCHELYHVSPDCDGDIRRFPGRTYAHGGSRRRYDALVAELVDHYLALKPDPELLAFLEGAEGELRGRHRSIIGRRMALPRPIVSR